MYTTFLEKLRQAYKPEKVQGVQSLKLVIPILTRLVSSCRWKIRGYDECQFNERSKSG